MTIKPSFGCATPPSDHLMMVHNMLHSTHVCAQDMQDGASLRSRPPFPFYRTSSPSALLARTRTAALRPAPIGARLAGLRCMAMAAGCQCGKGRYATSAWQCMAARAHIFNSVCRSWCKCDLSGNGANGMLSPGYGGSLSGCPPSDYYASTLRAAARGDHGGLGPIGLEAGKGSAHFRATLSVIRF